MPENILAKNQAQTAQYQHLISLMPAVFLDAEVAFGFFGLATLGANGTAAGGDFDPPMTEGAEL